MSKTQQRVHTDYYMGHKDGSRGYKHRLYYSNQYKMGYRHGKNEWDIINKEKYVH